MTTKWDAWLPVYEHPFDAEGVYAVLRCYDEREGFTPGTHCNGEEERAIVFRSPQAFKTKEAALEWAYENDPGE